MTHKMKNTIEALKNKPAERGKFSETAVTQLAHEAAVESPRSNSFSFTQETIDDLKKEAEAAAQRAAELTQRRAPPSGDYAQPLPQTSELPQEETLLMMQNTLQLQMQAFQEQLEAQKEEQERQRSAQPLVIPQETKTGKGKWVGNIIFYIVLTALFIFIESAVISQSEDTTPRNIAGFSPMIVLSDSMRDVYARGDFLMTRDVDHQSLVVGDDITFITEQGRTVTHRIVGIRENHLSTGQRGFETKGVNNRQIDSEIVHARNVIGKVIFSSALIGHILSFIRENMLLAFVTFVLFLVFLDVLIKYILSFFHVHREKKQGNHEALGEREGRKPAKGRKKKRRFAKNETHSISDEVRL
ncbi:signal peptidase I [Lactococcus muris]|uniref:Signal peptidase I n=1 Tax=Lactococcus muris TaxID=2941330 RepID=A0ABV4DC92_9LACT